MTVLTRHYILGAMVIARRRALRREALKARHDMAVMLGYPSYAAYELDYRRTAKTPQRQQMKHPDPQAARSMALPMTGTATPAACRRFNIG